jgi:hypothetical protein
MYIFLRESKILLEYGGRFIHLDTVGDISCDQTFKEVSIDRRTLHNRNRFFKHKTIRAANTISGSLSLYMTKTTKELLFFELAGWNNFGSGFSYPDFSSTIPEVFNLYIINSEKSYKLTNCIITTIDLSLSKTFCGGLSVSFDAAALEETTENITALYPQGLHLDISPIEARLGNNTIQTISVGFSFTRQIEYLNSETLHNSNSVITNTRAIITDANCSLVLNAYVNTPIIDDIDYVYVSQSGLTIELDNALITKRDSITEVYQSAFDITPTNTTNYINLGGL